MLTFAALTAPLAAQTVPLGTAEDFAIFGATAISNTGSSVINGDVGISPNDASSITGFPPGVINGTLHTADGVAGQARDDARTAFNTLAGLACDETISADLGGRVLTPGVYCSGTSMSLTGTLTLDAQSDPDAQFVFQIGTTLTTAGASNVSIINGGQDCNVFWQVGSSATLGTTSSLAGSIIADQSITGTTGASASGRMLAIDGAVTLDTTAISLCQLVVAPPTLAKAFSPTTIAIDGTSTLTVTLSNSDPANATLTSDLVDTLPTGVVVADQPNIATTCGGSGTPSALARGTTVTLPAGRTVPANSSCTLSVAVTSALAGIYVNTLPTGALVTDNGNNLAPATATLTVLAALPNPPALGKAFNPTTIDVNGQSTLTITLSNPDPAIATLTGDLVDNLPNDVVVANPPNVATTCGGSGAPTALAGGSTVTLPAGRTIPANGSCTLIVSVTSAQAGVYLNTLPAGALITSNGNNPAPANATLTVLVVIPATAPSLSKAFNPTTISPEGRSTLTVTLRNTDPTVATLTADLVDTLPSGVRIAEPANPATTCGGIGAPSASPGGTTLTLPAGRSIPANGSCTVSVAVTATLPGVYVNTLPTGALVTSNGVNPAPASATLTVAATARAPTMIPLLSPWSLLLIGGLVVLLASVTIGRQGR